MQPNSAKLIKFVKLSIFSTFYSCLIILTTVDQTMLGIMISNMSPLYYKIRKLYVLNLNGNNI